MLQDEKEQKMRERELTLRERLPPLNLSGLSLQQLQVFFYNVMNMLFKEKKKKKTFKELVLSFAEPLQRTAPKNRHFR